MIITEKYNSYIINIFFKDGTEKTIEDVAGYYIDTDTDILSIIFNKDNLSYDKYYIKTIKSLEVIQDVDMIWMNDLISSDKGE